MAVLTKFVETACVVVPLSEAQQEPAGCSCTETNDLNVKFMVTFKC